MPKTLEKLASTKKIQLVFIAGLAGVGKTTVATSLLESIKDEFDSPIFKAVIYPLAEPIKKIAYYEFGWDGKKDERGRRLLQVIGTDAGREYNENIWVEKLDWKITNQNMPPNFVFIDDWRFHNEKDYFKDNFLYEITTIRVIRDIDNGSSIYNHVSENELPKDNSESTYDFIVDNSGSLEELDDRLDNILAYLRTKIIFR